MEQNVFSLPKLLWQVVNVQGILGVLGILIALVIMAIRFLYLIRKDRNAANESPAPSSDTSLGDVIRAHRTRCHMTQEFVAESLGVSRQAVSKWESGAAVPSTTNLLALARLFQVDAAELLRAGKEQAK